MLSSLAALTLGGCVTAGVPLDEAVLAIVLSEGDANGEVNASFRDSSGANLGLEDGQSVEINGTELDERRAGTLEGEVPLADSYLVTVREPTRGVLETTVDAPTALTITAPATGASASLSGFDLTWAALDGSDVTITLRQTLLGTTETATFGPTPDTGMQTFTAMDLQEFRQGADLTITLQRTSAAADLNGIDGGTFSFEQETSVDVSPSP